MSKTQHQLEREAELRRDRERITGKVLDALGKPPNLLLVAVTPVGVTGYRVNIFVTHDKDEHIIGMTERRIAHSFFVTEKGYADALMSEPIIKRIY